MRKCLQKRPRPILVNGGVFTLTDTSETTNPISVERELMDREPLPPAVLEALEDGSWQRVRYRTSRYRASRRGRSNTVHTAQ